MTNLSPCPFCGAEPKTAINSRGGYLVGCFTCSADGPTRNTVAEAISAWNRRATASTTPETGTEKVAAQAKSEGSREELNTLLATLEARATAQVETITSLTEALRSVTEVKGNDSALLRARDIASGSLSKALPENGEQSQ